MTDPFIIMSAPNGARRSKHDHPLLPMTANELADCAAEVVQVGASILHLHVRDAKGAHSIDADHYRTAIAAIKARVGDQLIVQVTSEAVGQYCREEQVAMIKNLKPEAVSLALRELCPSDATLTEFAALVTWMAAENVFPQYILYDDEDYQRFERYRRQGVFQSDTPFALFVLGAYHSDGLHDANTRADILRERTTQAAFPWAVCGFGIHEPQAIDHAARHAGHIRVGFENSILRAEGDPLKDHSERIVACHKAAENARRLVASVDDVRRIFTLK